MTIQGVFDVAACVEAGRTHTQNIWKPTAIASGAGRWSDMSVTAGTPIYNAYVGTQYERTALTGAGNRSIYAGPGIAATSQRRVLSAQMGMSTAGAAPVLALFADYVAFYPLIDCDSVDAQAMDNTVALPRFTDGDGLQAFVVCQVPNTASATATLTISYTNHAGVSGRTSTSSILGSAIIGTLLGVSNTSASINGITPFVPLQSGDRGIRSIQSVTLSAGIGGFANIVLCKPLFHLQVWETGTVAEIDFVRERAAMPKLESGAFLQYLLLNGSSSTPSQQRGAVTFIWD